MASILRKVKKKYFWKTMEYDKINLLNHGIKTHTPHTNNKWNKSDDI
jgi:hypothetical protein